MPDRISDPLLLQAALIGLQQMKANVDAKMSDVRRRLGMAVEPDEGQPAPKKPLRKKRRLSAAGRANIIAALKKRWAERRKEEEQAKAKLAPKVRASAKSAPQKASVKVKRTPAKKAAAGKTGKPKSAQVTALERTAPATEA
jgi:hypothetical protein